MPPSRMVTDYDCWHDGHDAVDVGRRGQGAARQCRECGAGSWARMARDFPIEREPCPNGSHNALEVAIITAPEAR